MAWCDSWKLSVFEIVYIVNTHTQNASGRECTSICIRTDTQMQNKMHLACTDRKKSRTNEHTHTLISCLAANHTAMSATTLRANVFKVATADAATHTDSLLCTLRVRYIFYGLPSTTTATTMTTTRNAQRIAFEMNLYARRARAFGHVLLCVEYALEKQI